MIINPGHSGHTHKTRRIYACKMERGEKKMFLFVLASKSQLMKLQTWQYVIIKV